MARQHLLATTTIGLIAVGLAFVPGSTPVDPAQLSAGVPEEIELEVLVRARTAAGDPALGATARVEPAEGPGFTRRLDELGEVRLADVALPASVTIELPGWVRTTAVAEDAGTLEISLEQGASLRGRVADPAGVPLGGARVVARPLAGLSDEDLASWESETGADGEFRFDTLPAGPVWFQVSLAAHAPLEARANASATRGVDLALTLEPAASVVGQVTHEDGSPADEPEIHFAGSGVWPARFVRGDPHGRFELQNMPSGVYEFRAQLAGAVSQSAEGVTLEEGEVRTLDFVLRAGLQLRGRVVDTTSAQPISGAEVIATEGALSLMPAATRSAEDGTFAIGPLPTRAYRVRANARDHVAVEVPYAPSAGEFVIRLERAATLRGRVLDALGAPISGAVLRVVSADTQQEEVAGLVSGGRFQSELFEHHRRGAMPLGLGSLGVTLGAVPPIPIDGVPTVTGSAMRRGGSVSGADGRFALRGIPSGRYQIRALHPDYAPGLSQGQTVEAGADSGGWTVRLTRGATVEGRVVDGRGYPISGVSVEIAAEHDPVPRTAVSGADGRFLVSGVTGRVTLTAAAIDMPIVREELEVTTDATHEVILRLPESLSTLSGRVLDGRGFPVEGVSVSVRSLRRRYPTRRWVVSADDGTFSLTSLPPPPYRLEADHRGYALLVIDRISSAEDELEVALVPGGRFRGRVIDEWSDEPVAGARVRVRGAQQRAGRTGGDGWITFERLPVGRYRIEVESADHPMFTRDFEIVTSARGVEPIVLDRLGLAVAGRISGEVQDRYAEVVAQAEVTWGDPPDWSNATRSNERGQFTLRGIPPGETVVTARHPAAGSASSRHPIRVRAREETSGAEVRLPMGVTEEATASGSEPRTGVAITLENVEGGIEVTHVIRNSLADRAGIRAGDRLLSVDEEPVFSASQGEGMIRGPRGREFILVTERDGRPTTTPVRAEIYTPPD